MSHLLVARHRNLDAHACMQYGHESFYLICLEPAFKLKFMSCVTYQYRRGQLICLSILSYIMLSYEEDDQSHESPHVSCLYN